MYSMNARNNDVCMGSIEKYECIHTHVKCSLVTCIMINSFVCSDCFFIIFWLHDNLL